MNKRTPIQQERQEALNWLIEQFSAAFFSKAKQVQPLKLGIYEDLLDFYERLTYPPLSKKALRDALNYYSSSKAYLSCQTEGAKRIDLFGYPIELVTKEQAAYAQNQLAERVARLSKESETIKE